jgi:hypothetical protein
MRETEAQRAARADAVAENRRRSAILAGMLPEPGLVAIVAANVERIAAETGRALALPDDPSLVDVERVAEVLGVPVTELLRPMA